MTDLTQLLLAAATVLTALTALIRVVKAKPRSKKR